MQQGFDHLEMFGLQEQGVQRLQHQQTYPPALCSESCHDESENVKKTVQQSGANRNPTGQESNANRNPTELAEMAMNRYQKTLRHHQLFNLHQEQPAHEVEQAKAKEQKVVL